MVAFELMYKKWPISIFWNLFAYIALYWKNKVKVQIGEYKHKLNMSF